MPKPRLTIGLILSWADTYHARHGEWPRYRAGPVEGGPVDLTWQMIDAALRCGLRGLLGGDSLARLLARERGYRNVHRLPPLSVEDILRWVDRHRCRNGRWPTENSGPVQDAPAENWQGINAALREGFRGLPGNDSLAKLIARKRNVRNQTSVPPLTVEKILALADVYKRLTGFHPTATSGKVLGVKGETWGAVNDALLRGLRGLRGGIPLYALLRLKRKIGGRKSPLDAKRRGAPKSVGRRRRAIAMRARGLTYTAIGKRLGISYQAARVLVVGKKGNQAKNG